MTTTALTHDEKKEFVRLDSDLRKALTLGATGYDEARTGFRAAGEILGWIAKKKLYRASHKTFAAYCWDRRGISVERAYQLIRAAKCGPLVHTLNERQTRVLLGLAPATAKKVVAVAQAAGPLTAKKIETAKETLARKTAGLTGKEKAEKEAEIVREAEAQALRTPAPERKRHDGLATGLAQVAEMERRLVRLRKEWRGEAVDSEWERIADQVQAWFGRLRVLGEAAR